MKSLHMIEILKRPAGGTFSQDSQVDQDTEVDLALDAYQDACAVQLARAKRRFRPSGLEILFA